MRVAELENCRTALERDLMAARAVMNSEESSAKSKMNSLTEVTILTFTVHPLMPVM